MILSAIWKKIYAGLNFKTGLSKLNVFEKFMSVCFSELHEILIINNIYEKIASYYDTCVLNYAI
jgi:hypothetical protein